MNGAIFWDIVPSSPYVSWACSLPKISQQKNQLSATRHNYCSAELLQYIYIDMICSSETSAQILTTLRNIPDDCNILKNRCEEFVLTDEKMQGRIRNINCKESIQIESKNKQEYPMCTFQLFGRNVWLFKQMVTTHSGGFQRRRALNTVHFTHDEGTLSKEKLKFTP
jgi:hypothetical protein